MSLCYDIYAISNHRTTKTIEQFLTHFGDRAEMEDKSGHEIMVDAQPAYAVDERVIPIQTLTQVIDYGVAHPQQGFSFYISKHLKTKLRYLILKFTYDQKMIVGISVELTDAQQNDNYPLACILEEELVALTNAYASSIQVECAPADDEEEFYENKKIWEKLNVDKK